LTPRAEFDLYVNSAEVGLAKPDPAIYQLTLDRLGVRPEEAIFIDDHVRNTDAAICWASTPSSAPTWRPPWPTSLPCWGIRWEK
jgi:hypothetical protein